MNNKLKGILYITPFIVLAIITFASDFRVFYAVLTILAFIGLLAITLKGVWILIGEFDKNKTPKEMTK